MPGRKEKPAGKGAALGRVVVSNRQRKARVSVRALSGLASSLAALARVCLDEATLILVDDVGCAPINAAAVGHEGPTDVITLSYPALPGEEGGDSAEIVLNVERAIQQRPEDPSAELAFYLAHAFNHLSGRDDDTPARRTAMHRREHRWLARLSPLPLLVRVGSSPTPNRAPG